MAVSRLSTGSVVKDPLMGHPYWGHPIGRNCRDGPFGTIPGVGQTIPKWVVYEFMTLFYHVLPTLLGIWDF